MGEAWVEAPCVDCVSAIIFFLYRTPGTTINPEHASFSPISSTSARPAATTTSANSRSAFSRHPVFRFRLGRQAGSTERRATRSAMTLELCTVVQGRRAAPSLGEVRLVGSIALRVGKGSPSSR